MNQVKFQRKALVIGILGAGALMVADLSMAQGSDVTNLSIEEITVTAQKREEDVQSVPISISTLSANDIERRGVQNSQDLVGAIPNMGGLAPPGAKGALSISLRGVSSGSPSNLSLDTAVASYVDGVLIGKNVGGALDVAELERIEVLRGPQGTLYGRNSTGGAVNFVTKKPSGEFGGKVSGTVGNDGIWGYKASVDTPSLGTAGEGLGAIMANLGISGRERDALYNNKSPGGNDLDSLDREAYRVALRWEATDSITVDYAYDKSEIDEDNPAQAAVGLTPLAISPTMVSRVTALQGYVAAGNAALKGAGPLAIANQYDPVNFGRWLGSTKAMLSQFENIGDGSRPSNVYSDSAKDDKTSNQSEGHSVTASWQVDDLGVLGDVEFKSISGWREVDTRNTGDLDGFGNYVVPGGTGAVNDLALGVMYSMFANYGRYPAFLLQPPISAPQQGMSKLWNLIDEYRAGYFTQDAKFWYSQFSQELQMVGSTDRLEYALGYYYFNDNGEFDNYRQQAVPVGGIVTNAYSNDTEANAIYMQGTYTPPILDDKLALTLGYRHTEEEKGVKYRYLDDGGSTGKGLFSGSPLNLNINLNYTGDQVPASNYGATYDQKFSNDSGSATIAYQLTDDTNVFVRWAQGYRSGGYNGEVFNNPFDEETIEAWELGMKSDLVPGSVRLNASLFQYNYDDMQVSLIKVNGATVTSSTTNAGEAERWGAEAELQWSPLDNLLVALSYTHLGGNFDEFPEICSGATCLEGVNIAQRPISSDNSASLVTDWVFAQTDWAEFMAHLEVFWQSKQANSALWGGGYGGAPYIYDNLYLDSRTLVNGRIGIENVKLGAGTMRSSLWVRNMFDEDYTTYGINFASLGPITEQYGEERTFGMDVSWEF